MQFRAISPTDALSQELTMRSLLNSTYGASPTTCPATTASLQMINSQHHHHRLASPSLLQYSTSATAAAVAGGGFATADQSSNSMAALLADHYSRVIRSRAIYDSMIAGHHHQQQHVYKRSHIPLKKTVRTKFVYGHSGLNKKMMMMSSSSSGVKPLGPPPALPRATLGHTLKGLKN